MIPETFFESVGALPGIDGEAFRQAMSEPPAVSVKLNRRKCSDPEELGYGALMPVAWCRDGFYLDRRPLFTLNPLLHAGVFYVQDASSMVYGSIVARLAEWGLLPGSPAVADFCAAPGGKTTSIINALPDSALVVANEFVSARAVVLRENLLKWGFPNIIVTGGAPRALGADGLFDLVAVDAPCSGEGMMRKDETAVSQWSPGLIRSCAALQREILADAVAATRPGGCMIYSTCTFNRTENEENAEWLVSEFGLEPVDMEFSAEWGIGGACGSSLPAMRFMPHLTRGEGLFAAVFRKPGTSAPADHDRLRRQITGRQAGPTKKRGATATECHAKVLLDGIPTVTAKGKLEIPASEWTLATNFPGGRYPQAELDEQTALAYLRHEAISLAPNTPRGFVVVTYKRHPLGFVKNIGPRANNLHPAPWRIRLK